MAQLQACCSDIPALTTAAEVRQGGAELEGTRDRVSLPKRVTRLLTRTRIQTITAV